MDLALRKPFPTVTVVRTAQRYPDATAPATAATRRAKSALNQKP